MKNLGLVVAALASVAVLAGRAEAALLTINDGTDVWTLNVATSCTTCAVSLSVQYGAASARSGLYLDSIQWDLDNPNVNPTNVAAAGFLTSTTAGTAANWTFAAANLNANQCGGGNGNAVCGAWSGGNANQQSAGGFGPIAAGSTLTWTFNAIFASPLNNLVSGNIRAAYNNANGGNAGIFSPGGGSFTTTGGQTTTGATTTTTGVPEPTTLSLLGVALLGAVYRLRRKAA